MKAVTKQILQIRADNLITKIKAFLKDAKTREEVKKLVNDDWLKAEYAGIGKKDHVMFFFLIVGKNH